MARNEKKNQRNNTQHAHEINNNRKWNNSTKPQPFSLIGQFLSKQDNLNSTYNNNSAIYRYERNTQPAREPTARLTWASERARACPPIRCECAMIFISVTDFDTHTNAFCVFLKFHFRWSTPLTSYYNRYIGLLVAHSKHGIYTWWNKRRNSTQAKWRKERRKKQAHKCGEQFFRGKIENKEIMELFNKASHKNIIIKKKKIARLCNGCI